MGNKSKLPPWLVLTGQSGVGKGTAMEIIEKFLIKNKTPYFKISTGEEVRSFKKRDSFIPRRMKEMDDQGNFQPAVIAASLWFSKIDRESTGKEMILHEGSPRSLKELEMMSSVAEAGYTGEIIFIEICLSEEECRSRLVERTKVDKRIDLSLDGKPGVPDMRKIKRKMGWWRKSSGKIKNLCKRKGIYKKIDNSGSVKNLEIALNKLLKLK